MSTTNFSTFNNWRDYPPTTIVPVQAGNTCFDVACPHIRGDKCPYWGVLEWTTITITAEEIWQKKGYCPFYDYCT